MTIEFRCPHCDKNLRTSDDKAGRLVKCPQCGNTTTVPHTFGEFSAAMSEDQYRDSATSVPSAPVVTGPASLDIGEIISTSWTIFQSQMGMLIAAVVVVLLVNIAAALPANIIQQLIGARLVPRNTETVFLILSFFLTFLSWVFQIFTSVGLTIFFLKVTRGQPAEIGDLFHGGPYFLCALGAGILFTLMIVFGFLCLIVPAIILTLMFWPYLYVLVDVDPPGIGCLGRAREITRGTWLTIIGIYVISVGVNLLGVLACCVGLIFTIPLSLLFYSVAYCRMTEQVTATA